MPSEATSEAKPESRVWIGSGATLWSGHGEIAGSGSNANSTIYLPISVAPSFDARGLAEAVFVFFIGPTDIILSVPDR